MASPYGIRTLIRKTFSQRFLLSRLTSRYRTFGRLVDHLLFEDDDLMILPRDRVIPINRQLSGGSDVALPSLLLERLIRKTDHLWKMDFCICRESSDCRNYPHDLGCLFMGAAAMDINPKFGRPVTREEALAHVQRCREAGLVHLVGRNKLDAVWLNVGPGSKLLTVCNCCECCCLWQILPHVSSEIGAKLTSMPGVRVTVTDACVGCGSCTQDVCFVDAVRVLEGTAVIGSECRACGRCVDACPNEAIAMELHDPDFPDPAWIRLHRAADLDG
jgi:ferredoxin